MMSEMASESQSTQQSLNLSQPSQLRQPSAFQSSFHVDMEEPQIYSASYSGVGVYEMTVKGIAVMRRRNDSSLNATQILKVAGVEKGRRTKILEKEIQTGEHEKVQGGYGKYQGTWISFERGLEVCRQYGVEEWLRPLLTYDMGQDGGIAGRGDFNTPTKEQAMAAQRKRMLASSGDGRPNGTPGPFFQSISSVASHAVAAISKARMDSPNPRGRNGQPRPPSYSRQPSMQNGDDLPTNSQHSYTTDMGHPVDSAYATLQQTGAGAGIHDSEPPHKRQRLTVTPADSFGAYSQNMDAYANAFSGSPTEPNESFLYTQGALSERAQSDYTRKFLAPLPYEVTLEVESKRSVLMVLFMDSAASETADYDIPSTLSPADLDTPIDPQSHTALHWAAALARTKLLGALIAAGASPLRVNSSGETALMRACQVTNAMDHGSFPDLLGLLGGTIEARDHKGRTVLHHIAVTSAVKGRNAASRYYLESLLEWVVRQGGISDSQSSQVNGDTQDSSKVNLSRMGIARFMSEIVNAQDSSGDTALNIAARIGNRSIISQLLEVGADPNIANRTGLRPLDFGIGEDKLGDRRNGEIPSEQDGIVTPSQPSLEKGDSVIACELIIPDCTAGSVKSNCILTCAAITHLLNETSKTFQQEMKAKQASLDSLHASLRSTSSQLGEARRKLEGLTATLKERQLTRQKALNLSQAREAEQVSLMQQQTQSPHPDPPITWESDLAPAIEAAENPSCLENGLQPEHALPSAAVLRARLKAVEARRDIMRTMVQALKGRSREIEIKYRRVVTLCTGVPENEVDNMIAGLLKAVESEQEELDISRVRRFLNGVESIDSS